LHKYRLQKAEDFESKYEALFGQHQNTNEELENCRSSLQQKTSEAKELRTNLDQTMLEVRSLESELDKSKKTANEIRDKNFEDKNIASTREEVTLNKIK
jgi:chaperonin cofactor prefoldin